jgi:YVTN family beta-propeller protein
MKSLQKAALAAAVLVLFALTVGCGDTFRPVTNPILQGGGTAEPLSVAAVVSQGPLTGPCADGTTAAVVTPCPGTATNLNVAGDTHIGNVFVGRNPVHATFNITLGRVFVANRDDSTVTFYSPTGTFSPLQISLAPGSAPVFVHSLETDFMYVADSGSNDVSVISVTTATPPAVTSTIPVGTTPVALAQTLDRTKLYVVNNGSDDVSVVNTSTRAVSTVVPVRDAPVWATLSSDGTAVYVVNQGSSELTTIATATDTASSLATGPSPNFAAFDATNKRVYVSNSGGNTISVYDAAAPTTLNRLADVTVGTGPVSIAVLRDGSRAYVANSTDPTCGVSVVSLASLTQTKCISVGSTPVSIAASSNGSKVYVANRDSNSVSIIRTSDDTVVTTLPSQFTNPACPAATPACVNNRPVFVTTSP